MRDETIFSASRRILETVSAYQSIQRRGDEPQQWMEMTMRALSFSLILGFTVLVLLSGVSMAGSSDNGALNAGLFSAAHLATQAAH